MLKRVSCSCSIIETSICICHEFILQERSHHLQDGVKIPLKEKIYDKDIYLFFLLNQIKHYFIEVRVAQSLVCCVVFCRSLFVLRPHDGCKKNWEILNRRTNKKSLKIPETVNWRGSDSRYTIHLVFINLSTFCTSGKMHMDFGIYSICKNNQIKNLWILLI
jgi:hypothetical protein